MIFPRVKYTLLFRAFMAVSIESTVLVTEMFINFEPAIYEILELPVD